MNQTSYEQHQPLTSAAPPAPKKPKWVECLEKAETATRNGMVDVADRWIKMAEIYRT